MAGKLRSTQIRIFSEKIMDWGNLVFTGLVIAQLVPGTSPFRWILFLLGVIGITGAYITAYKIMK